MDVETWREEGNAGVLQETIVSALGSTKLEELACDVRVRFGSFELMKTRTRKEKARRSVDRKAGSARSIVLDIKLASPQSEVKMEKEGTTSSEQVCVRPSPRTRLQKFISPVQRSLD